MIKYFVNLSKLKEYAAMYKAKPLMRKVLIAGIGTDDEVLYKLFLGTTKTKPGFCIEVQNSDNSLEEIVELDKDDWMLIVKETADYYNDGVDEEPTYYCTNPSCTEFGEVYAPMKNDKGEATCPECGCILSEEEPMCSINYERLLEITMTLLVFVTSGDEQYGYELCENLDIEDSEYDIIMANYNEDDVIS